MLLTYVHKARYRQHTSTLCKSLNILKLQDINNFQIAVFMYKYYHNLLPLLFDDFFCLDANIHSYYIRRPNALHLPAVRTIFRKRSIIFTGPLSEVTSIRFKMLNIRTALHARLGDEMLSALVYL